MQLCEQAKLPYGILPEGEVSAERLAQYDMILLPEVMFSQNPQPAF